VDLKQKYIAVVGVSSDTHKFGYKIFKDLLDRGFHVEGINLKNGTLLGKKIFKNLSGMPKKPDLVLMVVAPEQAEIVMTECIKLGIKEVWIQPGAESDNAIEKAKQAGMSVISNSCFMVSNKIW
jgi:predicted CoA-binding protein